MKIKRVSIGSTGNGPCIEIEAMDGTYMWITGDDGCEFPTEKSWMAGLYDTRDEMIDSWDSTVTYLWEGKVRGEDMDDMECRALIISEMIKWGCDSFCDGLSFDNTWKLMMSEMNFNMGILTSEDAIRAQGVIRGIINNS